MSVLLTFFVNFKYIYLVQASNNNNKITYDDYNIAEQFIGYIAINKH